MANYYGGIITETVNPFARSSTSVLVASTGVQYSVTVSTSAVASTYANVETVTVALPTNALIKQLEFGFTAGGVITVTTAGIEFRYRITDTGGTSYDTLVPSTDLVGVVLSSGLTDVTFSGRMTPTSGTYFTGRGSFDVLCDVACDSTGKAAAATKNSSYITYKYYLVG